MVLPRIAFLGCIAILVVSIYAPEITNSKNIVDDDNLVFENTTVTEWSVSSLQTMFSSYDPELFIPLTLLSYSVEYRLYGNVPAFFKVTNLFLHLLNAMLVFWFVLLLWKRNSIALITSFFFALHPLHVQSVLWISARKDLLSALFILLSLITYYRCRGALTLRRHMLLALLVLLALLAKVSAMALPFLFLLIEYREGRRINRALIKKLSPYFLLAGLFLIIGLGGKTLSTEHITLLQTALLASKTASLYLLKVFLPTNLAFVYYHSQPFTLLNPTYLLSGITFLCLLFMLLWYEKRRPEIFFGLMFYLLTLAPNIGNYLRTSLDTEVYSISDRYVYVGSIGLIVLAVLGIQKVASTIRTPLIIGIGTILISLTFAQTKLWKNSETLFTDLIVRQPTIGAFPYMLGIIYGEQNKLVETVQAFEKTYTIYPENTRVQLSLGNAYMASRKFDDAEKMFTEVLRNDEQNTEALAAMDHIQALRRKR